MTKAKQKDKFLYPALPATMHHYAASIFNPIRKGECVTTIWVSMAGRRMWNKFIIKNIKLFRKELPDYQKYLLIYIEPLDLTEESLAGYLRLMGKSFIEACQKHKKCQKAVDLADKTEIFSQVTASYPALLEALKFLLNQAVESGLGVVFFLGEFDELKRFAKSVFYNNLKSLWDTFKPQLRYVFLSVADLTAPEITDSLGELNAATLQNVLYVPIRQRKDIDYLIDFWGKRWNFQFGEKEKKLIKKLCGGHPYLVKAASRIISNFDRRKTKIEDLEEILTTHYEMLSVARRIFNLRAEIEKEVLSKIAQGEAIPFSDDLKRLLVLGLVEKKRNGKYEPVGELFNLMIEKYKKGLRLTPGREANGLYLDEEEGVVCYGGIPVEEKFTGQEYNVIKFFLEDPGKLKTRDKISEILWGKESYEKYSDWAIDQVISKIRKKLKQLGAKTKLVTVRGRGYKLV